MDWIDWIAYVYNGIWTTFSEFDLNFAKDPLSHFLWLFFHVIVEIFSGWYRSNNVNSHSLLFTSTIARVDIWFKLCSEVLYFFSMQLWRTLSCLLWCPELSHPPHDAHVIMKYICTWYIIFIYQGVFGYAFLIIFVSRKKKMLQRCLAEHVK